MELTREQRADRILADPTAYKVCHGCGSIVTHRCLVCPSCNAYAFDDLAERVAEVARQIVTSEARSVTRADLA